MTVWEFYGDMVQYAIDGMKAVDFMYGISIWSFFLIFLSLDILAVIIATLFRHKSEKDGDEE